MFESLALPIGTDKKIEKKTMVYTMAVTQVRI